MNNGIDKLVQFCQKLNIISYMLLLVIILLTFQYISIHYTIATTRLCLCAAAGTQKAFDRGIRSVCIA